jgi:hypothetical protein
MTLIIAMAGLAEAAFAQALLIAWVALFLMLVVIAVGFVRGSRIECVVALGLAILFAVLLSPWSAFLAPENASALADPDFLYWRARFRITAVAWCILTAGALGLLPVVRNRKSVARTYYPPI